jgi:putative membrane protein
MMENYGYGFGHVSGWGIFGHILSILLIILVVAIVIRIVIRMVTGSSLHGHRCMYHHDYSSQNDSALEILKERYARGEINKEEFEAKKKDLLS